MWKRRSPEEIEKYKKSAKWVRLSPKSPLIISLIISVVICIPMRITGFRGWFSARDISWGEYFDILPDFVLMVFSVVFLVAYLSRVLFRIGLDDVSDRMIHKELLTSESIKLPYYIAKEEMGNYESVNHYKWIEPKKKNT